MHARTMKSEGAIQRPLHARTEGDSTPHSVSRFGILGVDVRLRSDSPRILSLFDHAWRWFPPEESGDPLELDVRLSGSGGARAEAGSRVTDLRGSPSPENQAFLFLLGAIMDRIEGSLLLHGAAVSRKGQGIILAGPAFAGKSTLVLELIRRGYDFLSDDAAPIDRRSGLLLPYPRAVGIRKSGGVGLPQGVRAGLPDAFELPHRWLVDPVALGAKLPAAACPPSYLFYLDPEGWSSARAEGDVRYEMALAAGAAGDLKDDLLRVGASTIEDLPARPFPTLAVSFARTGRTAADLIDVQGRHRESILYIEESRPPVPRRPGPPEIEEVPVSSLLVFLVRDLLNRGEGGRLMAAHGGRVASVVFELASRIGSVSAWRVASGSPSDIAIAIASIVRE